MRVLSLLILTTLSLPTFARSFGGISFHSTVTKSQSDFLSADLRYLYTHTYTVKDADLLRIGGVGKIDGPNLHNWLLNRVRFVVGESYVIENNLLEAKGFKFPESPVPAPSTARDTSPRARGSVKTIMSNLGAMLYVTGKQNGKLLGVKFDGLQLMMTSPRQGLLKVGEGLFLARTQLNKDLNAEMNSLFRLGTLFHEARHSDGNAESTGFMHAVCPANHPYSGFAACETSGNGSYTIGATSLRQFTQNCTTCTEDEKSFLELSILDSFSRVLVNGRPGRIQSLQKLKGSYIGVIESYEGLGTTEATTQAEKFKTKVEDLDLDIEALLLIEGLDEVVKAPFLNAAPEGKWLPIPLAQSMKLMEASLK